MIYPRFLKSGDTIGITAPSSGSENDMEIKRLDLAKENFTKLGYLIKETPDCRKGEKRKKCSSRNKRQRIK